MLRDLDAPPLAAAATQLATATLALEAWDAGWRCARQRAREAGAGEADVAQITAVPRPCWDAKAASAAARLAATGKGGRLTLAQSLMVLGQDAPRRLSCWDCCTDPESGGARRGACWPSSRSSAATTQGREQRCHWPAAYAASAPMAVIYLGLIAERRAR